MPEITANGLRFYAVDEGVGTPVVLLHGFPDTSYLWRNQIAALVAAGYRAIVPDLRGRGRSERPESAEGYRLTSIIADVAAIMDALGVERAHVIGHDWGAATAWLFATLKPQRVDRLIVASVGHPSTRGKPSLDELQKGWYRLLFLFPGIEATLQQDDWYLMRTMLQGGGDLEQYLADLAEPGALTAALNWYRANTHPRRELGGRPAFPAVAAPTMGMWSSGDNYLLEAPMVRSGEHVTGGWRYERIEGASHWLQLDEPERVNALLLDFFGSV